MMCFWWLIEEPHICLNDTAAGRCTGSPNDCSHLFSHKESFYGVAGVLLNGGVTKAKDAAAVVIIELPGKPSATNMDTHQQASASPSRHPCFPLGMRQRGVSQQRYAADMASIQALSLQNSSDGRKANLLCCATLGMSELVQLCLFGERSEFREIVRRARDKCDEMNVFYSRYGIRWYVEHTPGLAASILYEFES